MKNRWAYTLNSGKELRTAIRRDDPGAVLEALKSCFRELHRKLPEDFDEYDLDEVFDDIDNERDNLYNYEDYDMTYQDVLDNIDYILNNLYDICNALDVWIDV